MLNHTRQVTRKSMPYSVGEVQDDEIVFSAAAFAALGSPQRLAIVLKLVRAGPNGLTMGDLGERVGITGSVLTHHLKHLVAAGIVFQHKHGRHVTCYVEHGLMVQLSDFLLAECCADADRVVQSD